MNHDRPVRRTHLDLIFLVGLFDQVDAVTAAIGAGAALIVPCRHFQRRSLFKENRNQSSFHFVAQIFPIDELAARQRGM